MPDYKKMYLSLFHAATDAIDLLTECGGDLIAIQKALTALKTAQQTCEDIYIDAEEVENSNALDI